VEVHVVGVSDGGDNGTTVILQRPGHHILVLSSYNANKWNVAVSGGAVVDGIYAVGHFPQSVNTNVKTQVNTESYMEGGADAYGYAYPSKDTSALLKLTSIRVAHHATSFHGCLSATKWVIGEDMAVTADCGSTTTATTYKQYDAVLDCDGDNTCGQDGDGDGDTGDGSGDGSLY